VNEEKDESESPDLYAEGRKPAVSATRSVMRGCAIALGIAFLVFMFVVGACFMSL
jgi:hypothetical protein